ncbi:MAG TPA: GGDEF domain-containing phosphodiesterase [Pseudomonadales bacterium]|jgi:diguanylate cyclase (GGDEF)-like protein
MRKDKGNVTPLFGERRRPPESPRPQVVVLDSADFVDAGELGRELDSGADLDRPRLVLLERNELAVLRPHLEADPNLEFILKPVDQDTLQARIFKLVATSEAFRDRQQQLSRVQDHVDRLAYYDRITDLPNNEFFRRHVDVQIRHARRFTRQLAVLAVDLQSFERVRRRAGEAGTEALMSLSARRIIEAIRDYDVVGQSPNVLPFGDERTMARMEGDRFLLLLPELRHIEEAASVAERVVAAVEVPIQIGGAAFITRPKVGISVYPTDGDDSTSLIRCAQRALLSSSDLRGGRVHFHCEAMNDVIIDRLINEAALRRAFENGGFHLVYQPKVELSTGRTTGVEALLRLVDPELGELPPEEIVPLAEQVGLISELTRWVLAEVCGQIRRWRQAGLPRVPVSVNVSATDMLTPDFADFLTGLLLDNGVAPQALELEIPCRSFDGANDGMAAMVAELRTVGVTIAVGDFGADGSALDCLDHLPVDALKIDRHLIREITRSRISTAITAGAIAASRSLNLKVVAAGVETVEQVRLLRELDCLEVQGAAYSMPVSPEQLADWLIRTR